MGTETIPTRSKTQTFAILWVNLIRSVLSGNIVPRSTSGAAVARATSMGTPSIRWKKSHIATGDGGPGDVVFVYDYDGLVPLPQGWMWLTLGSLQLTQATYDAQHSAGDYAAYGISASPLLNKYLPSADGKYIQGTTGATQSGAAPITGIGSHTINLAHDHGGSIATSNDGTAVRPASQSPGAGVAFFPSPHTHTLTMVSNLSSAESIEPKYIPCNIMMRVI